MRALFDDTDPAYELSRTRLETELIAWLVTTTADGRPHPAPVWFFWHDEVVTILSEPDTLKIKHLTRGSQAVLHLDSGGDFGDDITVLHGTTRLTPDGTTDWLARHGERFQAKYDAAIKSFGMPLDQFATTYSTVIEFTPTRVVAWGK
jgi:PPOX class probable F420-dependent enzyme